MILPPRGTPVDRERRAKLRELRREFLNAECIEKRVEQLKNADQLRLFEVFSDEDVHRLCAELNVEYRERIFTPAQALGLFVSQVLSRCNACSTMVTEFNRERKRKGLRPISEDGSAYCKARAKIPVALVDRLSMEIVQISFRKEWSQWKWMNRNVFLVDGLVLRAPDTKANQEAYPQPSSQKEGLGFPQVRAVVTTSLATGCVVHYNTGQVEGKKTGEVSLFRDKHANFVAGDIVVADCNFESFHDAALLNNRGVALVCCMNASRDERFDGVCETIDEKLVTLQKPRFDQSRFTRSEWESLPDSIQYRVIRYRIRGGNSDVTIVTTLLDSKRYSAADIAELFGMRWDVEVDIRSYKTSMGMCDLRCLTPDNLDREIAVAILAYNLVRLLMCDAAAVLEQIHPREVSFSRARDAWRNFSDELKTSADMMWIILSATSRLVRDRPNRDEPRAIKTRAGTKYPRLNEPRPSRARRSCTAAREPPPQIP